MNKIMNMMRELAARRIQATVRRRQATARAHTRARAPRNNVAAAAFSPRRVGHVVRTFAPSVSAGFFFATAIAWMDVIRWTISQLVNVSKNGGSYYLMSAIFTTLLSVIVLMILARLQGVSYYMQEKKTM
jgi:hypothetical protein